MICLRIKAEKCKEEKKSTVFIFKSLIIDVEKKKLIINDKELPYEGITNFSLRLDEIGGWQLECKRNVISELSESFIYE